MSALKDLYNENFYNALGVVFKKHIPHYNHTAFLKRVLSPAFYTMELKQRTFHTAEVLHSFLPKDFKKGAGMVVSISEDLRKQGPGKFEHIFLTEYLAMYGKSHVEESIKAMEQVTQLISCEFAIRPFIIEYPDLLLKTMFNWTKHPSRHVRRLASEGSRPRLPWGMALHFLKKDPSPTFPILEALKNDSCEIVRRSVANHLNDISKDHPDVLLKIAKQWKGKSRETDAILKHACRTLLKSGDVTALGIFDLAPDKELSMSGFKLLTPEVRMGDKLEFTFRVKNNGRQSKIVRIEYAMHFLRSNGTHTQKVFKISEREMGAGEQITIQRAQSFKPITTRVYYKGLQNVAIIINGKQYKPLSFELK